MAMTYEVLKMKMTEEGKLTREEIFWMIDRMEAIEKQLNMVESQMEERLHLLEREKDDHIPGGI